MSDDTTNSRLADAYRQLDELKTIVSGKTQLLTKSDIDGACHSLGMRCDTCKHSKTGIGVKLWCKVGDGDVFVFKGHYCKEWERKK